MSAALRIDGLVAATFAPMRADGELQLAVVPRIVDRLVDDGVRGLYVCGTTGEGESLSAAERSAVAEAYVAAAAGRLPVLVQVGHNSYAQARELAAHAQRIGADGISALAPSYFKPASVELLVEHLAHIAGAAPDLPFYYYHLPRFTGVDLDMVELLRHGGERLPSLAGIKYSVPDVLQFSACAAVDGGRFELLWGCDEMLLTGLCAGARGAIGSTYNFAAPIYRQVLQAHAAGDLDAARRWQAKAVDLVRLLLRYRGLPAFKAAMSLLGCDVGPCRLPLRALDPGEAEALHRGLEAIDFFKQTDAGTP